MDTGGCPLPLIGGEASRWGLLAAMDGRAQSLIGERLLPPLGSLECPVSGEDSGGSQIVPSKIRFHCIPRHLLSTWISHSLVAEPPPAPCRVVDSAVSPASPDPVLEMAFKAKVRGHWGTSASNPSAPRAGRVVRSDPHTRACL